MIEGTRHTGIVVQDINGMSNFYIKFGLKYNLKPLKREIL